jgi:hypothetical protein
MNRRTFCITTAMALIALPAQGAGRLRATLHKSPQCGCCDEYAAYLRANGIDVNVKEAANLAEISRKAGIPEGLQGCHTMFLEGYAVDGHVPIGVIRKLLAERPSIAGVTLPGMPEGSPGMSGRKAEPFTIYAVYKDGAEPRVFAVE